MQVCLTFSLIPGGGKYYQRIPGLGVSPFRGRWDHGTAFHNAASAFDHLGATLDFTPLPAGLGNTDRNGNATLLNYPPVLNSNPIAPALPAVRHDHTNRPESDRYVCLIAKCRHTFSRPSDLDRHMKSRHCPPTFDCPVDDCNRKAGKGFPRKDKLRDHLRQKHRMEMKK